MKRRTRLIAGIFTLVALTFSFAETAWASTCAPGMEMGATSSVRVDDVPARDCMHSGREFDEQETSGEDERPCPFTPAAGQTCSGVASLPTHALAGVAPSVEGASVLFIEQTQYDLLLRHALFHPPRA